MSFSDDKQADVIETFNTNYIQVFGRYFKH